LDQTRQCVYLGHHKPRRFHAANPIHKFYLISDPASAHVTRRRPVAAFSAKRVQRPETPATFFSVQETDHPASPFLSAQLLAFRDCSRSWLVFHWVSILFYVRSAKVMSAGFCATSIARPPGSPRVHTAKIRLL
jgi:hypothetical protein